MTTSQPFDLRLPTPGCYNDPERAGLDAKSVFDGMTEHLFFTLGKLAPTASRHDLYMALSYTVRDRLMTRYLASLEAIRARPQKTVAYLSAEFLIGPQLNNNLLNLGIQKEAEEALSKFGIESLQQILVMRCCSSVPPAANSVRQYAQRSNRRAPRISSSTAWDGRSSSHPASSGASSLPMTNFQRSTRPPASS